MGSCGLTVSAGRSGGSTRPQSGQHAGRCSMTRSGSWARVRLWPSCPGLAPPGRACSRRSLRSVEGGLEEVREVVSGRCSRSTSSISSSLLKRSRSARPMTAENHDGREPASSGPRKGGAPAERSASRQPRRPTTRVITSQGRGAVDGAAAHFVRQHQTVAGEAWMTARGKLRLAILNDSVMMSKYVHDIISWAETHPQIELCHLILHPAGQHRNTQNIKAFCRSVSAHGLYFAVSKAAFKTMAALENMALKLHPQHADHNKLCDLSGLVASITTVVPIVSKSRLVHCFRKEDVAEIEKLNLDIILSCGARTL